MELRDLRVFVVAAEEGSFTRAGARLFLTQQAVSMAIRRLERHIGVALFARGRRGTELTDAGTALLPGARDLLERAERLADAVTAAETRSGRRPFRIGIFANGASQLNQAILDTFRARHPDVEVRLAMLGFDDHVAAVLDGRVDVAIVRPPVGHDERLDVTTILTEPQVLMVPRHHALAEADEVRAEEVLDGVFLDAIGPESWIEHWQLGAHRGGEPARVARLDPVGAVPTLNEVVALGLAISTAAASCEQIFPHPAVRHIPVTDAHGSDIAVARLRDADPLADAFVDVAGEVARDLKELLPGSTAP